MSSASVPDVTPTAYLQRQYSASAFSKGFHPRAHNELLRLCDLEEKRLELRLQ